MAALLATPAVAARSWTNRLPVLMLLAAGFAVVSGVVGTLISAAGPGRPTGPWFVVVLSSLAMLSLLLAPRRGVLARSLRLRRNRQRMQNENVLKCFYHLAEADNKPEAVRNADDLNGRRPVRRRHMQSTLRRLVRKGWLIARDGGWLATEAGLEQGRNITRRHRLWETWLAQNLHLPGDHLHDDAEAMEHIIGPEQERQLESEINPTAQDPHGREIPRD